jgi:VanZ family protein
MATGLPGQENPYQRPSIGIRLLPDAGDRLSVRRWLPPLAWAGVILLGTSLPSAIVPRQVSVVDKVLHFTIYAVLAALLSNAGADVFGRWRSAALAVLVAVPFAAADEWHQRFIPGRSTELADWYADVLGAALGALAVAILHWGLNRGVRPTR